MESALQTFVRPFFAESTTSDEQNADMDTRKCTGRVPRQNNDKLSLALSRNYRRESRRLLAFTRFRTTLSALLATT
jgi:hypothetical protein